MYKRKISVLGLSLVIFLTSLFLSGCTEKPFLTKDGSYSIITVTPSGMTQSELIKLPWNTNMAVMQRLLNESSFVLSDLHTPNTEETSSKGDLAEDQSSKDQLPDNQSSKDQLSSISLQVNFPEPKRMTFVVDRHNLTLDVQSLKIEVEGPNEELVTINQTIMLQGIKNPNLKPAFEALVNMLHDSKP